MRILLAGQPNCGKTTLFNALTGRRAPTGNRPGVTVEAVRGIIRGTEDMLLDLPGLYTLSGGGPDEALARQQLEAYAPDLILNVLDMTALERSLPLTLALCRYQKPMAVLLNMADEGERLGLQLDVPELERMLGVPCLPLCARDPGCLEKVRGLLCAARIPRWDPAWSGTETRHKSAGRIAEACLRVPGRRRPVGIDRILCGPFWGVICFLCIMAAVFFAAFVWVGPIVSRPLEEGLLALGTLLRGILPRTLPPLLRGMLGEGLWQSVGTVLAFLPQVAVLYFLLGVLEDCGYLPRAAFLLDRAMGRLGLDGRGAIMLLLGFGCTVPAALAARSLERKEDRERILRLLPFVPCTAKLPLTGVLASLLFPGKPWAGVGLFYGLSLLTGVIWGCLGPSHFRAPGSMTLELPPYRRPHMPSVLRETGAKARGFVLRAGPILLLSAGGLWLLMHLTSAFGYTESLEASLLAPLGRALAPLLYPLGLKDWRGAVVLLSGIGAKETMAAALGLLYGPGTRGLLPLEAFSLGMLALLLPPCISAQLVIRGETGKRLLGRFLWQTLFAYGITALLTLGIRWIL